jgi:aryl-alcohol dehydrogenase-like predicted oxidoreductase
VIGYVASRCSEVVPLKTLKIPGTDLISSNICLGTGSMGSGLSTEESFSLLDAFHARGGNFLDSAKVYADWLPIERSISERTIGAWMRTRKNRGEIIVGTKGAHPDLATMHIQRLSPEEIVADLEASLMHLGSDYIDFYWLHRDDPQRPVGEILETLNRQVQAGKIRYFGCSNWRVARIKEAQNYAQAHHFLGFSGNQMFWSLGKVDMDAVPDKTLVAMDAETWEYHRKTNLAAIPYSSQAGGLFNKMANGSLEKMDPGIKSMYPTPENETRLRRIKQIMQESNLTIAQVVLGYLLSQPYPTIPIVGCHTHTQLNDSLSASDISLTETQCQFLTS